MNKFNIFLFFILFKSTFSQSQELFFKQKPILFFDGKSQQVVLIENDSIVHKTKDKLKIKLKHTDYPGSLIEYIPFSIQKRTYLVHQGCGVVLEYRNDSIVRIDKSFLHKNQFSAATFVYKNEIYFLGGYGLFTHKNILTKYDFKAKEWFLVETANDFEFPALASMYSKIVGDDLFVFGGLNNKFENFENVWQLNMKTMVWKKFKTNFFVSSHSLKFDFLQTIKLNNTIYIPEDNKIIVVDLKKNIVKQYKSFFRYGIGSNIILDNRFHIIAATNNVLKTKNYVYRVFPINDILKTPISEEPFYYEERPYYLYGIAGMFILLLLWFLYRKREFISYYFNPTIPFQYWQETELLYFKGKKVKHLSEDDIKILNKMALHPNQFISLNEFNEMFTIDYENENYSAIVKRREKKLDTFLQLLGNVSSYDFQDLLHERKNEIDKRIKEVLFLPKKIKFVKK